MIESDGVDAVVARAARFDEGAGEPMETASTVDAFVVGAGEQTMWDVWFRSTPITSGTHVLLDNEDNDGGAENIPITLPADNRAGGANLRIGEDFDLPPQQFDGDIDEIRIGPLRPFAWIEATYATVTTEMATVGAEERLPRSPGPVEHDTPAPAVAGRRRCAYRGGMGGEFAGSERFVLERRIGSGGMGVVYEATDRRRDVRVALKTLRTLSGQGLARLKREFRALQNVEHPNLVSLGELVEADGHWFITMELVRGETILEYVQSVTIDLDDSIDLAADTVDLAPSRFDRERLLESFGQLALALQALHVAGLVHRDVKPSNVIVTAEGRVVLLDFGLVSDLHGLYKSADDHVVGTVAYMAPEQAANGKVGPAADWYAFGVVLYEALCGELPFTGRGIKVLLEKQHERPLPPSARAAGVPPELDELCSELLAFDPTERPTGEAVIRRLGARPSTSALPPSSSQPTGAELIGRDAELEVLSRAYRDARDDGPLAVYVRGESGLGKSALVRHFLSEVSSDDGAMVLSARCYQNESVPFKALDGIVDALASAMLHMSRDEAAALVPRRAALLPRIFPTLGRVEVIAHMPDRRQDKRDPIELRSQAIAALRELFERVADRQRLVLEIDDLHWADEDSARLLESLLAPPDAPSLLLVATARAHQPLPELPCPVRELVVGPLEPRPARRLARRLLERLGCELPVSPAQIATEAGGHPLYIDEIVRYLVDHGGAPGAAPRLDVAIWDRIRRLPEPAARIVELVAVAGVPLPEEAVLHASELPAGEFARHASSLRVSHLLRAGGSAARPSLQVYHDRVRESVAAQLDAGVRVERHRRLAVGLALTDNHDLEQLAKHLLAAGQRDRARDAFRRAAERAADSLAFSRAAQLYRTTLDLLDGDEERAELEERRGEALANAGRGPESAEAFRAALDGASGAQRLALQQRIAWQLLASGHLDDGVRAAEELAALAGMSLSPNPRLTLLRLVGLRSRLWLRGFRFRERDASEIPASALARIDTAIAVAEALGFAEVMQAACFHAKSFAWALAAGEPKRLARVLVSEAIFVSLPGVPNAAKSAKVLALLDELVARLDDPKLEAAAIGVKGVVAFNEGRFGEATELCARANRMFRDECVGSHFEQAVSGNYELYALTVLGKFETMVERLPGLLRDAQDRSDLYTYMNLQCSLGVWVSLVADAPTRAREVLAEALERWSERGFHLQHFTALTSTTNIDAYEGAVEQGYERVSAAWPDVRRSMLLRVQLLRCLGLDARGRLALAVARKTGDRSALAVARKTARRMRRESMPWARAHGHLLDVGLMFAADRPDDALAALGEVRAIATELDDVVRMRLVEAIEGSLTGGADGDAQVDACMSRLRRQGVAAPRRYLRCFVPWVLDGELFLADR